MTLNVTQLAHEVYETDAGDIIERSGNRWAVTLFPFDGPVEPDSYAPTYEEALALATDHHETFG